ncbi:MAG: TetR/AcrR family transcriptional regulator [Bacteroidales bacterium]|nr:TetR/AcrR family transcriptional regulator [Bacteroidales bacterium]
MKRKIHKEDIIQSGYDLFYDKGYGVTGINEITARIGIPKGSFYNHFQSKEEFGIAVLDYYVNNNEKYLKKALLNEKNSPLTNLKKFFINFIEIQENVFHCTRGCLMGNMTTELADVNSSFQEKAKAGFENATAIFEICLENAKEQEEISRDLDTHQASNFLINSWQGAVLRMKAEKTTEPLNNFYKVIFNQVIK